MNAERALLLVMMDVPAGMEEEFHDWYDTEHLPQRRSLPGIESGQRWVCVDGWPRWMAMYDLASSAALTTPEYEAVSGANSTPWSKRVLPRTVGRTRVCLEALTALPAPAVTLARVVLLRFPRVADGVQLAHALADTLAGQVGLVQLRCYAQGGNVYAVAAFDRVLAQSGVDRLVARLPAAADLVNVYAPYHRA